ncbi:MAG TPA: dTDP-glucose 4,6-dehydratase [Bryobacteraceae bacterium]|nr:dTDP-glucose 4,6-dehydratase [Bryobacteraceae bacterium]HPT25894.1 dTDP-glucose 4,6-dehydratase [Bryobacteraceae bacterium]
MRLLVTGGAGFIGSAFVRLATTQGWSTRLVNLDKLTYAGNLENLTAIESDPAYSFVHGDINDAPLVKRLLEDERPDAIVHFAAETHVDRSILGPGAFFETNLRGTFTLLEAARATGIARFLHVSTDEVYGSIDEPDDADETYPLKPSSPYSASKAGSDLLALSYWTTYRVPVTVTRASNNYGPYQFPEKLIPLMITNAIEDKPLPIYGDGMQVRDWLHVDDHCRAIWAALTKGAPGEIYNVGGSRALPNRTVVEMILDAVGKPRSLMTTVKDRPGHDRRYAITTQKLELATGWRAEADFESGLAQTIEWYRANPEWAVRVKSGAYQEYYERNYASR